MQGAFAYISVSIAKGSPLANTLKELDKALYINL